MKLIDLQLLEAQNREEICETLPPLIPARIKQPVFLWGRTRSGKSLSQGHLLL